MGIPERNSRLVLAMFPGSDALLSSNYHSSAGSAWLLSIAQEERRRLGFMVTSQSRQFVLPSPAVSVTSMASVERKTTFAQPLVFVHGFDVCVIVP